MGAALRRLTIRRCRLQRGARAKSAASSERRELARSSSPPRAGRVRLSPGGSARVRLVRDVKHAVVHVDTDVRLLFGATNTLDGESPTCPHQPDKHEFGQEVEGPSS